MAGTTTTGHDEQNEDRGPAPSDIVPNSWEHARQRLELLEACYGAASFRRAGALGVREGWRCLDAGAGHGSFARWLASQVAAAGSVIAADLETRLPAGLAEPSIEVRRMDLVRDPLPHGKFDFVHTRLVLTHLPAREQVLGGCARRCGPAASWQSVRFRRRVRTSFPLRYVTPRNSGRGNWMIRAG